MVAWPSGSGQNILVVVGMCGGVGLWGQSILEPLNSQHRAMLAGAP